MAEEVMVYQGREADGTIVTQMVVSDAPYVRKELIKWIKQGLSIEQVPLSWTRGKRLLTKDRYIPDATP